MTYTCTLSTTLNQAPLGPSLTDACPASSFFVFMSLLNELIRTKNIISGINERVKPVEIPERKYDFVVVGGGAGGSVVAGRLSENPEWKVLLLEAGPDESSGAQVPGFNGRFLSTGIFWNFTTNEDHTCLATNGLCASPSGKVLGGNTVHNGMLYMRGNPKDYEHWGELGNEDWRYDRVLPYFLKSEDNGEIERVGRKYHATGGPLPVERCPDIPSFAGPVLDAASELRLGYSADLNGDMRSGFAVVQAMQKKGVRRSTARAYLWPARDRRNLDISLNSTVTKVIMKNGRAVGVEYFKDGELRIVYATREVIVSAGAFKSPQILLLSGIGPKKHLESVGVEVIIDLPGVGENLHDHPAARISFTINELDTYENDVNSAHEYVAFQNGPLSSNGMSQVVGLVASSVTTPDCPDIEINMDSYHANCAPGEIGALRSKGRRTVSIVVSYLLPKSRGKVTLVSNDPFKDPHINVNYLHEAEDVERMLEAVKVALALAGTEALRPYNLTYSNEMHAACSGLDSSTDEYWTCVIRQANYPLYHQGGSCKMGPKSDPMAVVNSRLQVHGVEGLRVVDASIMPQITSGNTAAPIIMIGERGADFIKEDWMGRSAE